MLLCSVLVATLNFKVRRTCACIICGLISLSAPMRTPVAKSFLCQRRARSANCVCAPCLRVHPMYCVHGCGACVSTTMRALYGYCACGEIWCALLIACIFGVAQGPVCFLVVCLCSNLKRTYPRRRHFLRHLRVRCDCDKVWRELCTCAACANICCDLRSCIVPALRDEVNCALVLCLWLDIRRIRSHVSCLRGNMG